MRGLKFFETGEFTCDICGTIHYNGEEYHEDKYYDQDLDDECWWERFRGEGELGNKAWFKANLSESEIPEAMK